MKWSAVSGAENYRIMVKEDGASKWTTAGTSTTTSYVVTGLTSGKTYRFTVRCVTADGKTAASSYSSSGLTRKVLAPIVAADLKFSNLVAGVKISWNKVAGAEGYIISRRLSTESTYREIKRVSGVSTLTYTDIDAVSGKKYYYNVRAFSGTTKGGYSGKSFLALGAVVKDDMTITNISTTKMTVKWGGNKKADGYQVRYSADSAMSGGSYKTVTVSDTAVLTRPSRL